MTDFIAWNKTDDTAFRAHYFAKTGEKIQDEPTDADTQWQIGSNRLSMEILVELLKFSGVTISAAPTTYKNPAQLASEAESLAQLNQGGV